MDWISVVAYYFGGLFLTNAIPHLVNGMSGRAFPTPFADPPGRGLSSPTVNVLWAFANLTVAYAVLIRIGSFQFNWLAHAVPFALGAITCALTLARTFAKAERE